MDAFNELRDLILGWDFLSDDYRERALELMDIVQVGLNGNLIDVAEASDMLDVSQRHIWRLADNPEIDIWRYNADNTRKMTNRKTNVYFRITELNRYMDERAD